MGENYGLFINDDLDKGSSHPTRTFDSPCLTNERDFIVSNFEIWGLDADYNTNNFNF